MTKYELYQILDENGFEPSEENLGILTECLEEGTMAIDEDGALYECLGIGWKAAGKRYAKRGIKADALEKKAATASGAKQKELQEKAQKLRDKNAKRDETMAGSAHVAKRMGEGIKEVSKNVNSVKKARETTKEAAGILNASYDLSKLLEDNGFETTDENIAILKEGLENGNTIILSAGEVALTESLGSDNDALTKILVENGYKVTENNLKVLAEAIENGHVLLEKKEIKDHKKEHVDEEAEK